MTTPTPQFAELTLEPGSRLEQLVARYPDLKAAADQANEELNAVKTAIKAEMNAAAPHATRVDLAGPLASVPLTLRWVGRRDFDTKKLKAELPEIYEQYRKPEGSGRWELRES